jgi:hypothetical protein
VGEELRDNVRIAPFAGEVKRGGFFEIHLVDVNLKREKRKGKRKKEKGKREKEKGKRKKEKGRLEEQKRNEDLQMIQKAKNLLSSTLQTSLHKLRISKKAGKMKGGPSFPILQLIEPWILHHLLKP